ncbi:LacI family DNA-binding transcriptional regulator [Kribbella karoonensis]|uniref:LacI family DNA-binding transcriptional regulator n=1 Tax=Kribbella karoonensis TaxID=324851 RepID=A0ABP4QHV5_9ACTN
MAERGTGRSRARRDEPGATIYDVAHEARVSTATVSRVVNGNYSVSAATRARVEEAMQKLGYVTNAHARALAGSGRQLIGILIEELGDPYFAAIARGAQLEATAHGRLSLVCNTQGNPELEDSFLDLLLEHRADLVVVVGGPTTDERYQQTNRVRARRLASTGCRLAHCGRPPLDEPNTIGIEFDNEQGAFTITDHLLTLGHDRILFLGGPPALSTTQNRIAGFERAYRTRGRSAAPDLIVTGAFTQQFGYRQMKAILDEGKPGFTAVFGGNDLVAAGVYLAAKEHGLRIPEDLSIVGYDDVPLARALDPQLTTVRVPTEAIGREAVKAGLAHVTGGSDPYTDPDERVSLGTSLMIRGSTAAPRS